VVPAAEKFIHIFPRYAAEHAGCVPDVVRVIPTEKLTFLSVVILPVVFVKPTLEERHEVIVVLRDWLLAMRAVIEVLWVWLLATRAVTVAFSEILAFTNAMMVRLWVTLLLTKVLIVVFMAPIVVTL